jgi:hypothetical protein
MEEYNDEDNTLNEFINFALCSAREILKGSRTFS